MCVCWCVYKWRGKMRHGNRYRKRPHRGESLLPLLLSFYTFWSLFPLSRSPSLSLMTAASPCFLLLFINHMIYHLSLPPPSSTSLTSVLDSHEAATLIVSCLAKWMENSVPDTRRPGSDVPKKKNKNKRQMARRIDRFLWDLSGGLFWLALCQPARVTANN